MRLAGSQVVVTGAGGGIGAALVTQLLAAGAHVVGVGRSRDRLEQMRATLPPVLRSRVALVAADVTRAPDRDRIVARVAAAERPLRALVHAAAVAAFERFETGSAAHDAAVFATNVEAPIALTRQLLPLLRAQSEAAVLAVGSTFGQLAYPGYAVYSASKFALRGWIEAMAREFDDGPVRFQWIAPRATRTGFNHGAAERANAELGVAMDRPETVAAALLAALEQGRRRQQLGWPERLFVKINALFPALVDRSLRAQLPVIRRHLDASAPPKAAASAEATAPLAQGVTP